ncbi:MAG TPA: hypothetical protein VML55_01265 [Planctomycetaceae bacterium]|nr:hypothetical protein [Planctomycetaceae bacterium]
MSVIGRNGLKVVLPRTGPDNFWQRIQIHYAARDGRKWKQLAMLALHEAAGWPLEFIGFAFDHPKGHIVRTLDQVKDELRDRFTVEWDDG